MNILIRKQVNTWTKHLAKGETKVANTSLSGFHKSQAGFLHLEFPI